MGPKNEAGLSPLFLNGVEAVENGIEDFDSKNPRRLSSAIRNVTSGVLLILKEKLRRLSSTQGEFLLAKKLATKWERRASGKLVGVPVPQGHQTVDTEEIRERLQGQGVKLPRWTEVKNLVEIRNHVEHRAPATSETVAREAIANATAVLEEFLRKELDCRADEVFSNETWARMLGLTALNDQVRADCEQSRSSVQLETDAASELVQERLRCGFCGSELVAVVASKAQCRACGKEEDVEDSALKTLREELARDFHEAATEGGPEPLVWCEQCSRESFVVGDDACFLCGEGRQYTECLRCGNGISAEEQGLGGLCSWCEHMSAKAMADD